MKKKKLLSTKPKTKKKPLPVIRNLYVEATAVYNQDPLQDCKKCLVPDIDSNLKVTYNRAILSPGEVVERTSKELQTVWNNNLPVHLQYVSAGIPALLFLCSEDRIETLDEMLGLHKWEAHMSQRICQNVHKVKR